MSVDVSDVLAAAAIIMAAAVAAWATRRNAKDAQERTDRATAVSGYQLLTADQRLDLNVARSELVAARGEITGLRSEIQGLRDARTADHKQAKLHIAWDRDLIAQVNQIPGIHVEDPPPLYVEE